MEPFSLAARALFDVGRDLTQRRRRVLVRTHGAVFHGSNEPCLMINVVNVGQRPTTITHVWVDAEPAVHVLNAHRSLPKRLEPDEPWETWVRMSELGTQLAGLTSETVLRSARVRLSTGRIIKAMPNRKVPAIGAVPGAEH